MFNKEFLSRVSIQQLGSFFQFGAEEMAPERGGLETRYRRWEQAFLDALIAYRDAVLAADWSEPMTAYQKQSRTEALYQSADEARCRLKDIALEAGLCAGVLLCLDFYRETGFKPGENRLS